MLEKSASPAAAPAAIGPAHGNRGLIYRIVPAVAACLTLCIAISATTSAYAIWRRDAGESARDQFYSSAATISSNLQQAMMQPVYMRTQMMASMESSATDDFDMQTFRDAAASLISWNPGVLDVVVARVVNASNRVAWEAHMTTIMGFPVHIRDPQGTPIPYGNASRVHYPIEVTRRVDPDYLAKVIGLDLSATPERMYAIGGALKSRKGVSSPPYQAAAFNDRVILNMRALRPRPVLPVNASSPSACRACAAGNATGAASVSLSGLPCASDPLTPGRPMADYSNETLGEVVKLAGVALSSNLLLDAALTFANAASLSHVVGAITVEDLTDQLAAWTDLPSFLTDSKTLQRFDFVQSGMVGTGGPIVGALNDASEELLRRADYAATIDYHRANQDSCATCSYIVGFGSRRIGVTFTSTPGYMEQLRSGSAAILAAGLSCSLIVALAAYLIAVACVTPCRKEVQEQERQLLLLEARQDVQDKMTAWMSHELRNPSHVISRSVELIAERLPPDHEGRADLEAIMESAEAMHRLINDVIAFHHLRQQNLTIQLSVFDCRSFVARLCATHRSFATVPMHCVVDDDVPECMISDRMRVAQIVSNGLTNSGKFCISGSIKIHAKMTTLPVPGGGSAPAISFSVIDTGSFPGLDRDLTKIFDPFAKPASPQEQQVDASASSTALACWPCVPTATAIQVAPAGSAASSSPASSEPSTPSAVWTPLAGSAVRSSAGAGSARPTGESPSPSSGATASMMRSLRSVRLHQQQQQQAAAAEEGTSASLAAKLRGAGLGLKVASMLSEKLGGELRLWRDQAAGTTVFCTTLPIVPHHLRAPVDAYRQRLGAAAASGVPVADCGLIAAASEVSGFSCATAFKLWTPPAACIVGDARPSIDTTRGAGAAGDPCGTCVASRSAGARGAAGLPAEPSPTSGGTKLPSLGLHVLVCDDERLNRLVLQKMLAKLDCTAELVEEGGDAVDALIATGQITAPSDRTSSTSSISAAPAAATPVPTAAGAAAAVSAGTPKPLMAVPLHVEGGPASTCNVMVSLPASPSRPLMTASSSSVAVSPNPRRSSLAMDAFVPSRRSAPTPPRTAAASTTTTAAAAAGGAASASSSVPSSSRPRPYDVVFMDVVMRTSSGLDTTILLRRQGLRIPVIAATGNRPGPEYAHVFNGTLEKPFTMNNLLRAIREHVPPVAAATTTTTTTTTAPATKL